MSNASQYELNSWVKVSYPNEITGYQSNLSKECHGFTNYATFKIIQCLFDYPEFRLFVQESDKMRRGQPYNQAIVEAKIDCDINDRLAGIHFNNKDELKEYVLKYLQLDWLLPNEYKDINWKEVWVQLGHDDDWGDNLKAECGLTGSSYDQLIKDNPDYLDLSNKLNAGAQKIGENERKQFKLDNAVIIIKSYLHRLYTLRRCPQALTAVVENKKELKTVVMDLYQTFKAFPKTGDVEVDGFLSRCHLA